MQQLSLLNRLELMLLSATIIIKEIRYQKPLLSSTPNGVTVNIRSKNCLAAVLDLSC